MKYVMQQYHVWVHDSGDSVIRTTSYNLPEHLHEHVDVIQPTYFARANRIMMT